MGEGPVDERRCRATNRSGERCRKHVVPGLRVCRYHGGATKASKAAAARRVAEAEGARLLGAIWNPDAAPVANNVLAMKKLAGQLTHAVDVLGGRLDGELDGPTASAWARVLGELRRLLLGMERLGLEERHIELQAAQAQIVSQAFQTALAVAGHMLLPAVREEMIQTFLEELRAEDARRPEVVRGEVG